MMYVSFGMATDYEWRIPANDLDEGFPLPPRSAMGVIFSHIAVLWQ
jgi:hypothetical protein